jgi:hypothetical protein
VSRRAPAQRGPSGGALAQGDLFAPLLADPHEPGFFATYLFARKPSFSTAPGSDRRGPSWSVLLTAYRGPTPYGQFYRENLSSMGVGIALGL